MAESAAAGNDKSELKRLLKVASSHPVYMAMAIGPDGKPIMRMDKTKNAKALEKMIRAESPSAKDVRFGSVSVDPDESTEATFMLNKPLSGGARKLAAFLKPVGISKVNIVMEDGTPADSASDDEAPAGAGGAGVGAGMSAGADLVAGGPLSSGPLSSKPPAGAALAGGAAAGAAMGNAAGDHHPRDMSAQQAQMIAEARAKHGGAAPSPGAHAAPGIAGHAVPGQHGHKDHGHAGAQLAAGHQAGEHGSGKAVGQVVKGKDAAAGLGAIAALSEADFAKLMKAMQAELVHLHHPDTGPIKAVPPVGSAVKAAPAANGAHADKPKPVVKLSDADLAKLQELAKAGHFTLVPADAASKAPDGKDATGKDAAGKDAAGKVKSGTASPHSGSAPGAESVVAKDAKYPGAIQAAGGIANAAHPDPAHPDPAHPDPAKSGHAVGGKVPDKAGAAMDAASKTGATAAPNGKAPAAEDDGAMTAAKMTKDLTALVKRVMDVVKQNPSQQAELSRLAIDAQGSIRANDLESAAATMQVLTMSLDAAAGEVPAMADVHAKVNEEWESVRAHIEADLDTHKAAALKAGVDSKLVEEAHASAQAALGPALAGVQSQIDTLKQAKNDADLAAIKKSSQSDLDKLAIHLNNDKLFNLVDVFSPFKPMRALGTIAQFASKFGKGLHLFK